MSIRIGSALGMTLAACGTGAVAQSLPAHQTANPWFNDGAGEIAATLARDDLGGEARNVILFVGDGMGVSTLTAARILDGQRRGENGEEGLLSFERFPHSALVRTYNVDAQTPDSAGTMTAMVSGVKTDAGVLGLHEGVARGDCASAAGIELDTALELAERKGLSTGIVSTARITHATPAATYAKSADRNWEDDSDMPAEALAAGCIDIARQLLSVEARLEARHPDVDPSALDGIDVVMGGGRRHFLPTPPTDADGVDVADAVGGDRTDGRDLIGEWQTLYPDGRYVADRAGFDALDADDDTPVLALLAASHMRYEEDRANAVDGEPSLTAMTRTAIDLLDDDADGYFLMVESGRIDHAHHAGSAFNALTETIEFAEAVQAAVDATDATETLILVTADHGHVFTIGGYPKRGNPILGKVIAVGEDEPELAEDDLPYTTLGYANGLGFRDLGDETDADASYGLDATPGRQDLTAVDTTSRGFHQEALVPLGSETHGGEEVTLHARGPGATRVNGLIEQNIVYHVIDAALGLDVAGDGADDDGADDNGVRAEPMR